MTLTSAVLLLLTINLFAGCGPDGVEDEEIATLKDAAVSAISVPVVDAGGKPAKAVKAGEDVEAERATAIEESKINQVDTVRPRASKKYLPKVPVPSFDPPAPSSMIRIPAGTFKRGSAPEDNLRDQYAENDNIPTKLGEYEIDALPYPNDPTRPFLTGVSRLEAEEFCSRQGKRLCSELEWERACKGEDDRRYPTGNYYNSSAYSDSNPIAPAAPTGAFAMGRLLEWTSSRWGLEADQVERVAVRGFWPGELSAGVEAPPHRGRRCAKRWHRQPETAAPNLGFRCCRGAVNGEECFLEGSRPAHSIYNNMKPDKFMKVIQSIPELNMIHDNPRMFSDADVRAVLARRASDRKDLAKQGIHFRWKPMRWIPRQGTELWVAVGRSQRHSFVVALHEVEDNETYVHASSLILWNQPAPLALAYREGHRDQMYWAPCWGCRDGGTIEFDDEKNEVIITFKW